MEPNRELPKRPPEEAVAGAGAELKRPPPAGAGAGALKKLVVEGAGAPKRPPPVGAGAGAPKRLVPTAGVLAARGVDCKPNRPPPAGAGVAAPNMDGVDAGAPNRLPPVAVGVLAGAPNVNVGAGAGVPPNIPAREVGTWRYRTYSSYSTRSSVVPVPPVYIIGTGTSTYRLYSVCTRVGLVVTKLLHSHPACGNQGRISIRSRAIK